MTNHYLIVIIVDDLPEHNESSGPIGMARAVNTPDGKGAIVQKNENLYQLTCIISGCSWTTLAPTLAKGVDYTVMFNLPQK